MRVQGTLFYEVILWQLRNMKYSMLPQSTGCRECIYNADGARNALITAFMRSCLSAMYGWTFIARSFAYAQIRTFG